MRTIIRNPAPPDCLTEQPAGQDWGTFMQTDCHRLVGQSLRAEQYHVCCYCESEVTETDSHIEHYIPRNGPDGDGSLTYSYRNIGASCNGGPGDNRHCGHFKGGHCDGLQFVPPDNPSTCTLFQYLESGNIIPRPTASPAEQARARYLIDLLNLNCPRLVGRRRDHARNIRKTLRDPSSTEWIVAFYLDSHENGTLRPFHSLSRTILLP